MITYFSKKNTFNIVLLFFYAVILKFSFFNHPQAPIINAADGAMYRLLVKQLYNTGSYYKIWASVIAFILVYTQALLISNLISKSKLLQKPNYLVGMSYLLLTSLFLNWNVLSSALVVNTILIYVWYYITQLQNTNKPKTLVFNIGLLICGASFFYSFSFTFLILAFIGLLTYRSFRITEYLVLLLGFTVPFYLFFVYQYMVNTFSFKNLALPISMALPKFNYTKWVLAACFIILLLLIIGLYYIQRESAKMSIQARKGWSIVFFWFLLSMLVPFLSTDFHFWILCLLPIAAFIASTFYYIKDKRISKFIHWSVFIFAIFIQYFLHK